MKGRELEDALIEALNVASKDADNLGVGFVAVYAEGRVHDGTSYTVAALDPRTVTIGAPRAIAPSPTTAPEIADARPTEDAHLRIRAALDREIELDEGVRAFPDKPTFIPATAPTKWRCSPHGNTVIQDDEPKHSCKDADRAYCTWSRVS